MNIYSPFDPDKEDVYRLIIEKTEIFDGLEKCWYRFAIEQIIFDVRQETGQRIGISDLKEARLWYFATSPEGRSFMIHQIGEFHSVLVTEGKALVTTGNVPSGQAPIRYVYLFKVVGTRVMYKIGISHDPVARSSQIARHGVDVSIVHTFPASDAQQAEKLLHDRFASKRLELEYFDLDPGDVRWICSILSYAGDRFKRKA